jgi:hypothetical protein
MKKSTKTLEDVSYEEDDGMWPTSSFVLYRDYCSERIVCSGCWAEKKSFDDWPCNECRMRRPNHYSETKPEMKKKARKVRKIR